LSNQDSLSVRTPNGSLNYTKTGVYPKIPLNSMNPSFDRPPSPSNEILHADYKGSSTINSHGVDFDEHSKLEKENEIKELAEIGFDMAGYEGTFNRSALSDELGPVYTLTQADISQEARRLTNLPQISINNLSNLERASTIRFDRESSGKGVDWQNVVNWGEEWKCYNGGVYPETVLLLEGDLSVEAKEFEMTLDPQQMQILRKLEMGEETADIGFEDYDAEF